MRPALRPLAAVVVTLAGACAPTIRSLCTNPAARACDPDMTVHSVSVDPQGRAVRVDRTDPGATLSDSAYRAHVGRMLAAVRDSARHHVLVRIHGGLNELGSSLQASSDMTRRMLADPAAAGYPIFVDWESGIRSAYAEHVVSVTQGQPYHNAFRATLGTVAYFAADVGRAAAREPIVWFIQVRNFLSGDPTNARPGTEPERATPTAEKALLAGAAGATLDVWKGDYHRSRGEAAVYYLTSVPLFPLKMFGTFVVDAGGTPGWANMHRRVKTMFRTPAEFDDDVFPSGGGYRPPTGAVSILFDSLQALAAQDTALRVTLIGHSMGAIVAAEIVRTHPDIRYDAVVLMAAASSTRDVELSILPYLARHHETQLYDLTLHPLAELREQTFFKLGPNGSLLEWIDAYLDAPESETDRTMGKYTNVVRVAHVIPPGVRGQVHVKAFGYHDPLSCGRHHDKPSHHGDFNDDEVPFWNPAFWRAGVPCPTAPARGAPRVAHPAW